MIIIKVGGEDAARRVAAALLDKSAYFAITPLPDDEWEIQVKSGEGLELVVAEASMAPPLSSELDDISLGTYVQYTFLHRFRREYASIYEDDEYRQIVADTIEELISKASAAFDFSEIDFITLLLGAPNQDDEYYPANYMIVAMDVLNRTLNANEQATVNDLVQQLTSEHNSSNE